MKKLKFLTESGDNMTNKHDLISAKLEENSKDLIFTKLRELNEILAFTIDLSNEDKHGLVLMGDKSIAFVDKALEMARLNKELVPAYLDIAEVEKDFKLANDLAAIMFEVESLHEKIRNTYLAAGSDAFYGALSFYDGLKAANKAGIPGLNSMLEELAKRFPGRKKDKLVNQAAKVSDITA